MKKKTHVFIFFWIVISSCLATGVAAERFSEIDLRGDWYIYKDGDYQLLPIGSEFDERVIYLKINSWKYPNARLHIASPNDFFIFINGMFSGGANRQVTLSIDSIREKTGATSLLIAVYQRQDIRAKRLWTTLIAPDQENEDTIIIARASSYFHDFVILGVFIILSFLILIVAQNPKLAADYFSLRKLFGAPGSQDSLSDNRTTSSSNLLFQSFCSVLGAFLLTILLAHLQDRYALATLFIHHTLGEALVSWMFLSIIILVVFFVKQLVIYLFAYLFGILELAVSHYFNLIRLLFWVLGLCATVISIYLVVHGRAVWVFENVYFLIGWILGFWVLLIFFKLSRRVNFSMFHLFSYLCATEIIPLIITIKVLYY